MLNQRTAIRPATILDYWAIVVRYWMMIAGLVVASVVATYVLSKMSPKLYEAKATLFPARQEISSSSGISLGGDKEKGGGGGGGATSMMDNLTGQKSGPSIMEILHAILMSRRMAEGVIAQLNLMEYYGTSSLGIAINVLKGETDVRASPFKTYEVTVLTRDPKMAADIANAYVSNLDRLNKELNVTATRRNRLFIEARLEEKRKNLTEAENALKAFQTEHRLVVKEQAEVTLAAAADLHAQIVALEVQLAALREYATPSHPMINQLQAQIQELRSELDRMEQRQAQAIGTRPSPKSGRSVFPIFEEAPTLAMDLLRFARQVKVEEAVYGMLIGMLEQAKIAEARDVPTVQALDVAVLPEAHSRPTTLRNVQLAGALSIFLGVLLALFLNYLERIRAEASLSLGSSQSDVVTAQEDGNGDLGALPVSPKATERLHG